MYYHYFGLKEAPFSIAPNPEYLFMTERHQEALAHLYHGIESDAGFVLLTGDIGTGKTTVCRRFLNDLPSSTQIAFILNPCLGSVELLQAIIKELQVTTALDSLSETPTLRQLTDTIYDFLLSNHAQGINTVLLIDEAQQLHQNVLEQIRLLTNLETDKQKLLKIILVGQPELNDILAQKSLIQLSQRITARYHIDPLTVSEISAYIDFRLHMAGYNSQKKLFPSAIIRRLYQLTEGVPRLINVICDRALLGVYSNNKQAVNKGILSKAYSEVRGNYQQKKPFSFIPAFLLSSVSVLLLAIAGFLIVQPTMNLSAYQTFAQIVNSLAHEIDGDIVDSISDKPVTSVASGLGGEESNAGSVVNESLVDDSVVINRSAVNHSETIALPRQSNKTQDEPVTLDSNESEVMNVSDDLASDVIADSSSSVVDTLSSDTLSSGVVTPSIAITPQVLRHANKQDAFAALIKVIVPLRKSTLTVDSNDGDSCLSIDPLGWRCTEGSAINWPMFKRYNRPSVMTLFDEEGGAYYINVVGVTETHAKVLSESGIELVPLISLGENWSGEFAYLWQPPVGFSRYIYIHSNKDLIDWLAQAFATIDGRDTVLAEKKYNPRLKKRIILFQRQHKLKEDGKVGTETLLKLNEALGVAITLESPMDNLLLSSHHLGP